MGRDGELKRGTTVAALHLFGAISLVCRIKAGVRTVAFIGLRKATLEKRKTGKERGNEGEAIY